MCECSFQFRLWSIHLETLSFKIPCKFLTVWDTAFCEHVSFSWERRLEPISVVLIHNYSRLLFCEFLWPVWPALHSKNTRVSRDPEKGPLEPNFIPGQRWPENQSNWQIMGSDRRSSESYFSSSWLIFGSSLTRNGFWSQWTLYRVTLTRVSLVCGTLKLETFRTSLRPLTYT